MRYLIISKKIWDKKNYHLDKKNFFLKSINKRIINKINPDVIFFIHWSNIIKKEIYSKYFCIQFHCTKLPYGKGGSPVQNLIIAGKKKTFVTAFKVEKEVDSGPIILKRKISLSGTANDIYKRIENISLKMIGSITKKKKIRTSPQVGKTTFFKRRGKKDSIININKINNISKLYNFIRMLDAEDYPLANIKIGNFRLYFENAKKFKNKLIAQITVKYEK